MKFRVLGICGLLGILSGCGLFKKHHHKDAPVPGPKLIFEDRAVPALRQAFAMDYEVISGGAMHDFSVFPNSDKAYACDYMISGVQGTLLISDSAQKFARYYENQFGADSIFLTKKSAIWLSQVNYDELQSKGMTIMQLGNNEMPDTFRFAGSALLPIPGDDSILNLPVVNIVSSRYRHKLQFIANKEYPLITMQQLVWLSVALKQVQTKETTFSDFVPGPKCVLRYKMTEFGNDAYEYTATNVLWTDTLICFHIDGNYQGSPDYDFEYDVCFRKKALTDPDFEIPTFSVNGGKLYEDKNNFLFLRKKEVDEIEKNGRGFLTIPHFAPELGEGADTSGMTPEDIRYLRENFKESYHTYFGLMHTGRLIHTGYYFNDDENNAERILPSLSLRNSRREFEVQALNKGKLPLLLYYNDNMQWEITLEYAGFPK